RYVAEVRVLPPPSITFHSFLKVVEDMGVAGLRAGKSASPRARIPIKFLTPDLNTHSSNHWTAYPGRSALSADRREKGVQNFLLRRYLNPVLTFNSIRAGSEQNAP